MARRPRSGRSAGARVVTHVLLDHPWELGRESRLAELADFVAGEAWDAPYEGPRGDQFTEITLRDLSHSAVSQLGSPAPCYGLLEKLARVLPLRMPDSPLSRALARSARPIFTDITTHTQVFGCEVEVVTPWETLSLTRRLFGDRDDGRERWVTAPVGFSREIRWTEADQARTFNVLGYLLSQERANPAWTGLTVRVQNVAVEERTFFDLESDPGFRRYICGEVFLTGDVPREDLIALDRTALVRESPAYPELARVMRTYLQEFKSEHVQRPRRRKVNVRRIVDEHWTAQDAVVNVVAAAEAWSQKRAIRRLPSSGDPKSLRGHGKSLATDLGSLASLAEGEPSAGKYDLRFDGLGHALLVVLPESRVSPTVTFLWTRYALVFVEAPHDLRPVVIRNRPREVAVNLGHPAVRSLGRPSAIGAAVAIELARVLGGADYASRLDERILEFLSG